MRCHLGPRALHPDGAAPDLRGAAFWWWVTRASRLCASRLSLLQRRVRRNAGVAQPGRAPWRTLPPLLHTSMANGRNDSPAHSRRVGMDPVASSPDQARRCSCIVVARTIDQTGPMGCPKLRRTTCFEIWSCSSEGHAASLLRSGRDSQHDASWGESRSPMIQHVFGNLAGCPMIAGPRVRTRKRAALRLTSARLVSLCGPWDCDLPHEATAEASRPIVCTTRAMFRTRHVVNPVPGPSSDESLSRRSRSRPLPHARGPLSVRPSPSNAPRPESCVRDFHVKFNKHAFRLIEVGLDMRNRQSPPHAALFWPTIVTPPNAQGLDWARSPSIFRGAAAQRWASPSIATLSPGPRIFHVTLDGVTIRPHSALVGWMHSSRMGTV